MRRIPKLVQVKPLENYRVLLQYADGICGEADFSSWVEKETFQRMKDLDFFRQVHISPVVGALEWDSELDFCADALYLELWKIGYEDWQKLNHPSEGGQSSLSYLFPRWCNGR